MSIEQEIVDLQRSLAVYRQTLYILLEQIRAVGAGLLASPHLRASLVQMREGIAECKRALRARGVAVEDAPEDEPLSPFERQPVQIPVYNPAPNHGVQGAIYGPVFVYGTQAAELRPELRDQFRAYLLRILRLHDGQRRPYLGLATFTFEDADRFFGRDRLAGELVERLGRTSFLAVLGASGSGKSSLLQAGVLPLLKGGGLPGSQCWTYVSLKPGARPIDALAAALSGARGDSLTDLTQLKRDLTGDSDTLLLLARRFAPRLVLIVDQSEELWTLQPTDPQVCRTWRDQQLRPFLRQLLSALAEPDRPFLVLLSMRADFLHRAAADPLLWRAISECLALVGPMSADELREAIEQPARQAGGYFEPGLVDELIRQTLDEPGALPLLEYTLQELWEQRQPDGLMTWACYRELGGIEGALSQRAEQLLHDYPSEQQTLLRQTLLRLIQPGEGAADTRRRVPLADLAAVGQSPEHVQALLQPLINERLLTSAQEHGQPATVTVTHEALLRAWPTLRDWIGQARAALRLQIQLEQAAKEWQANARGAAYLWSGLRLARVEQELARALLAPSAPEREFITAGRAADRAWQRQTRQMRILRLALLGLAAVLLPLGIWQLVKEPVLRRQVIDGGRQVRMGQSGIDFDVYEVKNWRFRNCVEADRCGKPPENKSNYNNVGLSDFPVVGVDALEAAQFCKWVGGRLPTVVEWENMATNYDNDMGPWGNGELPSNYGNMQITSPVTVGETMQGRLIDRNMLGVYDLTGNVKEWTSTIVAQDDDINGRWDGTLQNLPEELFWVGAAFNDRNIMIDSHRLRKNGGYRYRWMSNFKVNTREVFVGFRCVYDLN